MIEGVILVDLFWVDVWGELIIGNDILIDVNVVFEGKVVLGSNVFIGLGCVIKDVYIVDGVEIKVYSVIEGVVVGVNVQIGFFVWLCLGIELVFDIKVGNFVEIKKVVVGQGSKINYLSYVGDVLLGCNVNVGVGIIICNYDGVNKFKIEIGDGVFVGLNIFLVVFVCIVMDVIIGVGLIIIWDVVDNELVVVCGCQCNVFGWEWLKKLD